MTCTRKASPNHRVVTTPPVLQLELVLRLAVLARLFGECSAKMVGPVSIFM